MLISQKLADNVTSLLIVQGYLANCRVPENCSDNLRKTKIVFLLSGVDQGLAFRGTDHQNLFSQCENRAETKLGYFLVPILDGLTPGKEIRVD
jgi:hypothetical protein